MSVVESLTDREFERLADRHLLVGGLVVVALGLRLYALGAESLWVDEVFTARVVLDYSPAYILLRLPIQDPHPPLYYELLWLWTRVTGVSETSVRALSALAGAASVPVVYAVADRLYDRRVGLVAALFFAVSPFYVWYGREARMYAVMTLLALASMYVLLGWLEGEDGPRASRWTYAVVTTGLVYTHAFGALLVLAQNVYVLFGLDADDVAGEWYGEWVRMQGVVGLASIPWLYNLLGGMFGAGRFENNVVWIPDVTPLDLWKILGSYVGRTQPPGSPTARRSLWHVGGVDLSVVGELVTLVAFVALASLLVAHLRNGGGDEPGEARPESGTPDEEGPESAAQSETAPESADPGEKGPKSTATDGTTPFHSGTVLACWLLVPVGAMYVASVLVTPLLFDRFTAAFGVAGVILSARAFTRVVDSDRGTLVAAGLVVLVLTVPLANMYTQPQKQQWEAAASVVESNADSGELVAVTPFWANDSYQYYAGRDDLEYAGIPEGGVRWHVAAATSDQASVWLVVAHHNASQFDRLRRSMDRLGFERDRHVSLTEVDVYHYVRTGD